MKESELQTKAKKKLEAAGWFVTKLIQTSTNGIPDLLCIRNGQHIFIEVKKEKGKLSPLQEYRIKQLSNYGAVTVLITHINDIDSLCKT